MFSGLAVTQPSTRRWTALTSFTVQSAIVAAALVLPMLHPQSLAPAFLVKRIFVPMSDGEVRPPAPAASTVAPHAGGLSMAHPIVVNRDLPRTRFDAMASTDNPPGIDPMTIGDPRSAIATFMSGPSNPVIPVVRAAKPPRASVLMEGNLIRRIEPRYPAIARQIRLQGTVVLNAIISREGNIERVDVASGPALLAASAKEAVEQWKYRPYLLNGAPVEVQTQITVNFALER